MPRGDVRGDPGRHALWWSGYAKGVNEGGAVTAMAGAMTTGQFTVDSSVGVSGCRGDGVSGVVSSWCRGGVGVVLGWCRDGVGMGF